MTEELDFGHLVFEYSTTTATFGFINLAARTAAEAAETRFMFRPVPPELAEELLAPSLILTVIGVVIAICCFAKCAYVFKEECMRHEEEAQSANRSGIYISREAEQT